MWASWAGAVASGLSGASAEPKIASSTITDRIPTAIRPAGRDRTRRIMSHPPPRGRGDPAQDHIDYQVERHDQHDRDDQDSLHRGHVAGLRGRVRELAEDGQREDRLDDDRVPDERGELHAEHRHPRAYAVP